MCTTENTKFLGATKQDMNQFIISSSIFPLTNLAEIVCIALFTYFQQERVLLTDLLSFCLIISELQKAPFMHSTKHLNTSQQLRTFKQVQIGNATTT